MSETTAEVPAAAEPPLTPPHGGLAGRVRRAGTFLQETFSIVNDEVPLEKIGPETVARTIHYFLGNSAQEKFGKGRHANGFTVVTLLQNSGHIAPIGEDDYMKAFPREHSAMRLAVQRLVDGGVVEMVPTGTPDRNRETVEYYVKDEEQLKKLAKQGEALLKR